MLGENELNTGKAFLRDMTKSEQTEISIDKISDYIKRS